MSHSIQTAGWILWAITVLPLTLICVMQWRIIEADQGHLVEAVAASYRQIERKLDLSNLRQESLLEVLERHRDEMTSLPRKLPEPQISVQQAPHPEDSGTTLSEPPGLEWPGSQEGEAVPSLPQGLSAEEIVASEIKDILSDERLNPQRRKPNRIEKAEIVLELHRAQEAVKVLESEIGLEVARGMEALREKSAYIEYGPGERYEIMKGVLTVAELVKDRTRMFYFYREQFPGIYEKRKRKSAIVDAAARRLIAIIGR